MSKRQARGDPRVQHGESTMSDQVPANMQSAIPIQCVLNPVSIQTFAIGYVTRSIEKGYAASASQPFNPYFAFVYLCELLNQFANGGTPLVQKMPYAILAFGRAISPKTCALGQGRAAYSFLNVSAVVPPKIVTIGYAPYGFVWNLNNVPSPAPLINGFPLSDSSPFPGYDAALGQAAFAEMNLFLAQRFATAEAYRQVSLDGVTELDHDTSTFAYLQNQVGLGTAGVGSAGFSCESGLETPIWRPWLSVFNVITNPGNKGNRAGNLIQRTAGDGTWIGATIADPFGEKHWGHKRVTKFHAVDFLEFQEVVAMWVAQMQQAFVDTESLQADPSSLKCPLTLQEVGLLLRNVLMTCFKETQTGAQGLYPIVPASGSSVEFVPFVSSATTCPIEGVDMVLPNKLIENMRALTWSKINVNSPTDIDTWCPVLGQYFEKVLDPTLYTYTTTPTDSPPVVYPSFTDGSALYEVEIRGLKGEKRTNIIAEEALSFVDGSGSSGLVAINNPKRLKELATMWNDWFNGRGLATYSRQTGFLGTDKGINILYSGNMTRHFVDLPPDSKQSSRNVPDIRLRTRKWQKVQDSPFATQLAVADTSQSTIFCAPYEQIQSNWILPVMKTESSATASTLLPRWQSFMQETFLMNLSSGSDGILMSDQHSSYASSMVKGRFASSDDNEDFMRECARTGRGGILSGLAAAIGGALFPKAAGTINAIASVIPF